MKILSKKESHKYLNKLLGIFNNYDSAAIDKYLASGPIKIFNLPSFKFAADRNRLPFLFWDGKELRGIYENIIYLSATTRDDDGAVYDITKYDLIKQLSEYLKLQECESIIGAGNWRETGDIGHDVITFQTDELFEIIKNNICGDLYFFDKDFSFMLAFNHHSLGFLVGNRKFIEGFANYYPEYRKFVNYEDSCSCC